MQLWSGNCATIFQFNLSHYRDHYDPLYSVSPLNANLIGTGIFIKKIADH
jgi:hypothetical protein